MEREKKNPYVTQIELKEVKDELNVRITEVDRKHDNNYADLSKLVAISEITSKNIVKSNENLAVSFDNFSKELKEELKTSRQSHENLSEKVSTHDKRISEYSNFITQQQKISDDKKNHLIKWVGALSAIFVALLAGIFGVIEVLIPYFFGIGE